MVIAKQQGRGNQGQRHTNKFQGEHEALKGKIFEYTNNSGYNTDTFVSTTAAIEREVGRTYKRFTGDLVNAVKNLELTDPAAIPDPDDKATNAESSVV